MSRNLDKNPFTTENPRFKQGLPVKKNPLLTATLISLLLLLVSAGTQFSYFVSGNPFSQSAYSGEKSPNSRVKPPEVFIFSPQNDRVYNTSEVLLFVNASTKKSQPIYVDSFHYITGLDIKKVYFTADWLQNETIIYRGPGFPDGIANIPEYLFEENGRWYESYFFMGNWYDYSNLPEIDFENLYLNLTDVPDGPHTLRVYTVGSGKEFFIFNNYIFYKTGFSKVNFVVDTTPPKVTILSLENTTNLQSDLPLNFAVNESVSHLSYSLDGQKNVTIDGNTTLTDLSYGEHNIAVFATDEVGNTGASEPIFFTIEEPTKPFPTTMLIAPAAFVSVIGSGLVFYFKKRKRWFS